MNDYKGLIEELRSCAEKGYFAPCEMEAAADAIEQIVKERDAAIDELRREPDNCQWCRWWKPKSGFVQTCVSPEPCCVDGNPDRWKWRGVQNG